MGLTNNNGYWDIMYQNLSEMGTVQLIILLSLMLACLVNMGVSIYLIIGTSKELREMKKRDKKRCEIDKAYVDSLSPVPHVIYIPDSFPNPEFIKIKYTLLEMGYDIYVESKCDNGQWIISGYMSNKNENKRT